MQRLKDQFRALLNALMKSTWTERIVVCVVVILVLVAIWLPPVALGARLFHTDYPLLTPAQGGMVTSPNGARLEVPAGAVTKRVRMRMQAVTGRDLQTLKPDRPEVRASQNVPADVIVKGPLYRFDAYNQMPKQAALRLPLPTDLAALETVDLYGWDGQAWNWLPATVSPQDRTVEAQLERVPALLMLAQAQVKSPRFALAGQIDKARLSSAGVNVTHVSIGSLSLGPNGGVAGQPPTPEDLAAFKQSKALLALSNISDGVVRSDLADNLLADDPLRKAHAQKIAELAKSGAFAGVEIAYDGLDAGLRAEFSAFVTDLASALHAMDKTLAVRVPAPVLTGGTWDTGAYDWVALGRAADLLRIPALADPAAYAAGGSMDKLFTWATSQVDRRKIDLFVSASSHDLQEKQMKPLSYKSALGLMASKISADDTDRMLLPGESIKVSLPDLAKAPLKFDGDAQTYSFNYTDPASKAHIVWLENASSVARKLQYVSRYVLGGFAVEDALAVGNDPGVVDVVRTFQEHIVPPAPKFALQWSIEDATGKTVDQLVVPLDNPNWSWTAPNNPGNYIIKAAFSDDGGKTNLGAASQLSVQIPTPTFTPTPTSTNTPTPTPKPTSTPTARPTSTPAPTQQGGAPTAAAKPTAASQAPAPAAAVSAPGYFGYGIQGDMMSDGDHARLLNHVKAIGFGWFKQQVEWKRYNPAPGQYDWGGLDRIVNSCNAYGVNILFSVVKAPGWARPAGDTDEGPPSDPNTYGTFLREMATRYKGRVKAYEIWNEQNLYYEWGGRGGKLSASRYVELLKVAFNAIKSVDPGAVVVSGALTPTGVSDGDIAIRDSVYLEQMYQAGLARYCDAVGAHPSGYNNPPDADWRSFSDPSTPRCKGDPSWFFRGTLESYRNIMVKYGDGYKRIWPTEFGWASVENLGAGPARGYEYAVDNSEGEQAQFIVRAYELGRAWGWVGPMFLWNLNFAPVSGKADEKAAFGIVREDWGARPAFAALQGMPK